MDALLSLASGCCSALRSSPGSVEALEETRDVPRQRATAASEAGPHGGLAQELQRVSFVDVTSLLPRHIAAEHLEEVAQKRVRRWHAAVAVAERVAEPLDAVTEAGGLQQVQKCLLRITAARLLVVAVGLRREPVDVAGVAGTDDRVDLRAVLDRLVTLVSEHVLDRGREVIHTDVLLGQQDHPERGADGLHPGHLLLELPLLALLGAEDVALLAVGSPHVPELVVRPR